MAALAEQPSGPLDVYYDASPTCRRFHKSDAFIRALVGPLGSGKSVACVMEMMRLSLTQEPGPDGVVRARGCVIRNTYRELKDTTLKTWTDWVVPARVGRWDEVNMTLHMVSPTMHIEILFRALDHLKDIKKLLSLELTWAWLNEAREIPKPVLDMLQGRVGRYPAKRDGGATQACIIMDTNPCDEDHWWYRIFEEERPPGFAIFHQPSGLSAKAENLANLPDEYYTRLQYGHDQEWVNVYVHGRYGFVMEGKPVHPTYQDDVHASDEEIAFNPEEMLVIGIDFGLTPAAAFLQQNQWGQWCAIDELVTEDTATNEFAELLNKKLQTEYRMANGIDFWGDPAGDTRAETDKTTPFMVLQAKGIDAGPVWTNDEIIRRGALSRQLSRLGLNGKPGFQVSPKARMLRKGLAGGFKYRRMSVTGEERYHDKPDKNIYSHIVEACEYALVGAGEGDKLIESSVGRNRKPRVIRSGGLRYPRPPPRGHSHA